jgi:uncharacterized membrane protein
MKLNKKLKKWQENALINLEQSQAILIYEAQQQAKNHWFLYGFIILGAVVTGIGIISIIAANWANLSATMKIGADFALLALLAMGIFYFQTQRKKSIWTEVLLLSFQLLCLASIGLISQIYHSGGTWYHALLLWSIITLPITLYSKKYFAHFFWVTLFLLGFVWSLVAFYAQLLGLNAQGSDFERKLTLVLLITPLFSIALAYIAEQFQYQQLANTLRVWFIISALSSLVYADILYWSPFISWQELQAGFISEALFTPIYMITGLLVGLLLFKSDYRALSKIVLLTMVVLLLVLYHPQLLVSATAEYERSLLAPVLIITILTLYAIHLGISEQQGLFNAITFLIGLRFLLIYFEVIGSLAATGVGLIISGLIIIGVSYTWYRARQPLQAWIRRLR